MSQLMQRKVCLLGDFAVGKTSLVRRFVYNKFEADYLATIGVNVSRKEVTLPQETAPRLALVLWDLAGGETFTKMEEAYYRGGAAALLVADVTRPETFAILNTYATTFMRINPGAILAFAFNKCDLLQDLAPAQAQAEQLAARWDATYYLTSALNGAQVEEAFHTLARRLTES